MKSWDMMKHDLKGDPHKSMLGNRIVLLSSTAILFLAGLPIAYTQNTTPVPKAFFAVSLSKIRGAGPLQGGIQLGLLGKTPGTTWKYLAPSRDCGPDPNSSCYEWGAAAYGLLGWVTLGQTNGEQLVYDFASMPGWLCSQQNRTGNCMALPSNLTAVSNFATAVATKFRGQIQYYETYNEANDLYGEWADSCANLVLLHNTIYKAVKAADPTALVAAPNLATGGIYSSSCAISPLSSGSPSDPAIWIQNFLHTKDRNGNLPQVDTIGIHTYGDFSYPGCTNKTSPNCYTPYTYGCDYRVERLHCAGQPLLNLYNAFRAVMNDNGMAARPLLVTEGGFGADTVPAKWCPSSTYADTGCLSPVQQVAYIGRWLVLSASTWSDGSGQLPTWYGYDVNWGTLNGSYGMNPQNASAFGQMEAWLLGAVFQQPCHSATPHTVFACDFVDGRGNQREIIFNDNRGNTAAYTTPPWATTYQPLLGTPQLLDKGTVTVGDLPILLTRAAQTAALQSDR